ncbi:MAG: phosphate transport system substrate-binding protein, partial [Kiritimatiellia bacterium]
MRPVAIVLTAAAVGCAPPRATPDSTAPTIQIVGSESMNTLVVPLLIESFTSTHDVDFQLIGEGSSAGFKALNNGQATLASSSREPTAAEREQAAVDSIVFERHLVGVNVISVTSHASNPLSSLTYGQVRGAFCTGELTNWSQLGLRDIPITVVVRDDKSGSREIFEDFFCGPDGLYPMHKVGDSQSIRA